MGAKHTPVKHGLAISGGHEKLREGCGTSVGVLRKLMEFHALNGCVWLWNEE